MGRLENVKDPTLPLKLLVDAYAGQILGYNESYIFCHSPVSKTFSRHWPKGQS